MKTAQSRVWVDIGNCNTEKNFPRLTPYKIKPKRKQSLKLEKESVFDSCTSVTICVSCNYTPYLIVVFKFYFHHDPPTS